MARSRIVRSVRAAAAFVLAAAACAGFDLAAQDGRTAPLAIGAVQGRGDASPMLGREATIEGVATAAIDGADAGWFVQDGGDGDPATSDALFVVGANAPPLGARVRVRGTVVEIDAGRGTRTALRAIETIALGRARRPKATTLASPPTDWERYENMRVRIAAPLTVLGTHRARRYGEVFASFGGRLFVPTEVAAPGPRANAVAAENARRLLRLDDGSDAESPATVRYLPGGVPRAGSRLSRVEGVVDQRGGGYRLQATATPTLLAAPRPRPPRVGGDLRVVAFNLENLFNGDGRGGGFPTPRGARTVEAYRAQLARHLATIRALKPDILALMELENDGYGPDSSIAALAEAMRAAGLGEDWRFVDAGAGPGTDQIRVAVLYRAGRVVPVGAPATLTGGPFESHSRVPMAQTFRALRGGAASGPAFTLAVAHLKSKGCREATGADADQGDGQGCWNATRTESARRLNAWLRRDPTQSGSDLAMIVGDMNAYGMEDPVRALLAEGWRDAYAGHGPAPYSYVYDSLSGRLDHALLSPALAARLAGAAKWHSNADEPEREDDAATDPWRSSDHDPLLVGFRLAR